MIKAVLFDFDGVILDSMEVKAQSFRFIFKDFPESQVEKLVEYHYTNGGIPRFDKIRYFFSEIIHEDCSEDDVRKYSLLFAKFINENLFDNQYLIHETVEFIKNNYMSYDFFVVSGAEEKELRSLCDFFNLSQFFKGIYGSPRKKNLLIEDIIKNREYLINEVILIGDSVNDEDAARENNISFFPFNNKHYLKHNNYIDDFHRFDLSLL